MYPLRKFLGLLFAISSLFCLWNALKTFFLIIHQHHGPSSLNDIVHAAVFPILTVILATACWTLWKKKPSGTIWGIAACLAFILLPTWAVIYSRSIPFSLVMMFAVGVIGLVILLWPVQKDPEEDDLLE